MHQCTNNPEGAIEVWNDFKSRIIEVFQNIANDSLRILIFDFFEYFDSYYIPKYHNGY